MLHAGTLCVAGHVKDAIVSACHRTSVGQEQKLIQRAGPERDAIFNHDSEVSQHADTEAATSD